MNENGHMEVNHSGQSREWMWGSNGKPGPFSLPTFYYKTFQSMEIGIDYTVNIHLPQLYSTLNILVYFLYPTSVQLYIPLSIS